MDKASEILWLDNAIKQLGPDTYLGATLADQRNAIVADIRNDIGPLKLTWLYNEQIRERAAHTSIEKQTTEARAALALVNQKIEEATYRFDHIKKELNKGIAALRSAANFAERSAI